MTATPDEPFIHMASAHIDLANAHGKTQDQGLAGMALLHAAARYNAFVSSTVAKDAEHMRQMRTEHVNHYVDQFAKALMQHYNGYIAEHEAAEKADAKTDG